MKSLVTIALVLLCMVVRAQSGEGGLKADSLLARPDTVVTQKLDSLQRAFTKKSDSIKQSYAAQKEKLASLKQRYRARMDSVRKVQPLAINTPANPLDTLKRPDVNAYTKKIDSLDQQLANLEDRTMKGIDSLKGKVTRQLEKLTLPKDAQGQAAKLTAAMDKVSVPSFDSDLSNKLGLDKLNSGLPDIPGTGNLPNANLPNANLPQVDANLPGVNAPDIKNKLPGTDINTGKLNELTGQAGDVQKQVQEATGSTEGLGKTLENKAAEQVKGLPDQKLPEVSGMPGGVPQTGEAAQQQLVDMAKKEAVNHFAGKEAVLTSAMEKMSKYKQKYSSVNSLKDIQEGKRYNELKGKPFIERLVPALTLQMQSWRDFTVDFNPSAGYKFTKRITAGLGWNQRVAFNIPDRAFNPGANVFGIRSYGEYNFNKGFTLRLDVETMNTPVKVRDITSDLKDGRQWVWGMLVGVKQKYPIYRKLMGNAQLMYNIFDRDHSSPYTDRVNFRIGLELTLKKKKPKAEEQKKQ